jgi:hypothetical protein
MPDAPEFKRLVAHLLDGGISMADHDDDEGLFHRLMQVWWSYLIIAVFFFGIALLCYWLISNIEERGGGRVNWLVALAYHWAGKVGTALLFAIPGAIFALIAVWKLVSGSEDSD